MAIRTYSYLIAFKAEAMESRSDIIPFLKERGAVHVMDDVWLLNWQYSRAGDVMREITRCKSFSGPLVIVKLNEVTDWCDANLPEDANLWVRENLASRHPAR
jgi:hypothetical protein